MLPWAATMLTLLAQPPDPATVGDGWRDTWFARMERTPAFVEPWLAHQRRDDYWRHGSVCEDYARSSAPVYAIGGWADGYTNAIPRLLAGPPGPRKGLIGPWSHAFPQDGEPGPAIGFLQECLRWWDHWLKDADTGVMDEPMLRAWMQEPVRPGRPHAERPGRWVAEPALAVAGASGRGLALAGLGARPRRHAATAARALLAQPRDDRPGRGRLVRRRRPATARDQRAEDGRRSPLPRRRSTSASSCWVPGSRSTSRSTGPGRSSRSGCATWRPTGRRSS